MQKAGCEDSYKCSVYMVTASREMAVCCTYTSIGAEGPVIGVLERSATVEKVRGRMGIVMRRDSAGT